MKITTDLEIVKNRASGDYFVKHNNATVQVDKDNETVQTIYNHILRGFGTWDSLNEPLKEKFFDELCGANGEEPAAEEKVEISPEEKVEQAIGELINFFSEFEFEPNFRFLNTLSHNLIQNKTSAINYIKSYFELVDSNYKNDIAEKVKSKEFDGILKNLKALAPTKTVNNRFSIYYGSQGTGKTTIAQTLTDNRCLICNASMLPADLMEDFDFADGKATFKKSLLWDCMEKGNALVLDEINLLPFDSLRFLQGLLDGKKEFDYKGNKVAISDGFKIIGTMNLTVNGMTYGLPEPLIDRCAEMKKFTLTAKDLISAII